MLILALTTLYPYPARPRHGIFVENRLRTLLERGNNIRVVAPVPWFPLTHEFFGDWSRYACPPAKETRHGIEVRHPQYLQIPKFGMTAAVGRLEKVFEKAVHEAQAEGFKPEILDAHYLFPDGVAATRIGKRLGIPVVLTARGSDVTQIPSYPGPKRMILEAIADADHVITVAEALRSDLISLGGDPHKITTIRNGINLEAFTPEASPAPLPELKGKRLLSVGHLIQRKGHDLVIHALKEIPNAHLVIVGGGPEAPALTHLVRRLKLTDRVYFAGEQPHDQLASFYAHADLLMLGSDREGWPNVLLEAMACGTPCVATPAGGVAEVITTHEAGIVTKERSVHALADAARTLLADPPAPAATRAYAENFGWGEVAGQVEKIWQRAACRNSPIGWGQKLMPPQPPSNPKMILTVDTEELFGWENDYSEWELPPVEALEELQAIAESVGMVPLYFISYPLIQDDNIGGRLASWHRSGRASAGLHMHGWVTPPLVEGSITDAQTFQCHLDPDHHLEKLRTLIDAFQERFSEAPVAHRAGRYGIAPWVLDQLAEEGVMFDFSPSDGFDFRKGQGPDFSCFGLAMRERQTAHGRQWVIPVSGSRLVRKARMAAPLSDALRGFTRQAQLNTTAPVRLTPEGNDLALMQKLTRHLIARGAHLLTPTLHQTSLTLGATPYAKDQEGIDTLLGTLRDYLEWAQSEGIEAVSLPQLKDQLGITTGAKKAHCLPDDQSSR